MAIDIRGMTPLLQVFDMPTSVQFYCEVLGFELVTTSQPGPRFHWALLQWQGIELMLNTAYEDEHRPPTPDPARVAAHGDTILYFGAPDVDSAYAHLRAKGIDVKEPKIAFYGMKQLYLKDPDGYGLCFQWAVPKER
jgi:catechol 2,3-dioxygenase-like lactoylglutathione lyase family enzyme